MLQILMLSVVLAALRHIVFWEAVLTDPATIVRSVEARPVVRELLAAEVMPLIEQNIYQTVDLRRDSNLPIIGMQLAWSLPMPHSMSILDRYRARATATRLAFVVTKEERDEGLQMLHRICQELGIRDAVLVVGGL
jgi:hypothetical protein